MTLTFSISLSAKAQEKEESKLSNEEQKRLDSDCLNTCLGKKSEDCNPSTVIGKYLLEDANCSDENCKPKN